jgi:hypothetical protein
MPKAQRDIKELVEQGVLIRNEGGSKNTSYAIAQEAGQNDVIPQWSNSGCFGWRLIARASAEFTFTRPQFRKATGEME